MSDNLDKIIPKIPPTEVKSLVDSKAVVAVDAKPVTKVTKAKPSNIQSSENKAKTLAELKVVVQLTNKCIASLSQNRINSEKLGSLKSLHSQIKSVCVKIDVIRSKIEKSIEEKPVKDD